jgi:signal recognition particle subunit SRP54
VQTRFGQGRLSKLHASDFFCVLLTHQLKHKNTTHIFFYFPPFPYCSQLKQNATKLRVPFYGSYTLADPVAIAEDGVAQFKRERYEVIIVDTSGRHLQEASLFAEMQEISAAVQPDNVILVMDATQGQAVYDQASAFSAAVAVGSVIVTKLDGHAKGGGALSAVAATQSPILFTGTGEHFEDLDPFYPESFISKLLGFGDVRGLMEAMKGTDDDKKKQEEMLEKMSKGEFTLRMMYAQFEKVMSMGSFGKLAGMIPGMPDYLLPGGGAGGAADQESTRRLRKFMIIMDSMNAAELDCKVDLHKKYDENVTSRIRRIAAGSGCHPKEIMMLLQAHKQFEGMISKMGKSGMIGNKQAQAKQAQLAAQMSKNPKLMQQRLNQMDPRVIQQMGGRDAVMAMMQNYAKSGGGGPGAASGMDMASMMSGGGGMPLPGSGAAGGGLPPLPPGMTMESIMKMAQNMGMGGPGGGLPPGMGR